MIDELMPPAVTPSPPRASIILRAIAKGLTKTAVWAVTHPEVIIQIVRQIKAEETAKQSRQLKSS